MLAEIQIYYLNLSIVSTKFNLSIKIQSVKKALLISIEKSRELSAPELCFESKLLNGSAAETRDAARESARYLSLIYSDSFSQIVDSALEPRDAHEFYKNT